jgi:dihydroflavonol-4-reductase
MLAEIAHIIGCRPPRLRLPVAAVYPVAIGTELWSHVSGCEPFITRDGLRMARHHMFFQDAKARHHLVYGSRPYREGIADAIAWFRDAGYLDDRRPWIKNPNNP